MIKLKKTYWIWIAAGLFMAVIFNNCGEFETEGSLAAQLQVDNPNLECDLPENLERLSHLKETCLGLVLEQKDADGLYDNIHEYSPDFSEVGSLVLNRRHWIYLPPGTRVNNEDPNYWVFPQGTMLWQQNSDRSKKIETRVLRKEKKESGFSSWRSYVFYWTEDQSDAHFLKDGEWEEDPGLKDLYAYEKYIQRNEDSGELESYTYKVPETSRCVSCHSGAKDGILGFDGFQLSGEANGLRLKTLARHKVLSQDLEYNYQWPSADTPTFREVTGTLHTNCGSCHNPSHPDDKSNGLDLSYSIENVDRTPEQLWQALESAATPNEVATEKGQHPLVCLLRGECDPLMPPTTDGVAKPATSIQFLIEAWIREIQ